MLDISLNPPSGPEIKENYIHVDFNEIDVSHLFKEAGLLIG